MPHASVIAMTLNHQRYVTQALSAIEAQTYKDFEVIVTDDGSTDKTPDIVDQWCKTSAHPGLFIHHTKPQGICRTLNEALARSTGDIVAIVSLDDVWLPDRLSRHIEVFEHAPATVAVVYSDCRVIDDTGMVTSDSYLSDYMPSCPNQPKSPPSGQIAEHLVQGNFIPAPGATLRRTAIESVGGYDESLPIEDWPMWLKLALKYNFAYDDGVVAEYRIHPSGYWTKLESSGDARPIRIRCLTAALTSRSNQEATIVKRLEALSQEVLSEIDLADACQLAPIIESGHSLTLDASGHVSIANHPASILYIAPWMTVGGADKATLDWFRYLSPESFRRHLVTTTPNGNNALFDLCDQYADSAWCLPELMSRQEIPQFVIEFIATRNIDLVHIMNSKLGFDLMPAIKLAFPDVPIVVQLHCEEQGGTGYPRYVASRYDSLVDRYSLVSDHLKTIMSSYSVSPSKMEVIHLGVDVSEFDPERPNSSRIQLEGDRLHVLFPARLTAQKRPELLLQIATEIRAITPCIQFHAVGDGELRSALEEQRDALGLQDAVRFHGASAEMWAWYSACDVVLLCSEFEGIPLVLFEAMSMSRPVVAPLVGGISELVDGTCGLGVDVNAKAAEYAEALVELSRDPERRMMMGKTARERIVDRFKVEDMARQHRELYAALIARYKLAQ